MKRIIYLLFIALAISCNSTKESKNTNLQKDSISSNTLIGKLDKDSIKILLLTERKVDTMTERRKVFLDYKKYSEYKEELYNISKKPLDSFWSKDVFRPKKSLDSSMIVNPFTNLKKTYISVSKLNSSYILFCQGTESLTFQIEYIGDTTLTHLDMMGWFVNYYRNFGYRNNKYMIRYQGSYVDSIDLEIKIIDKLHDIQIWKTTVPDKDKNPRVYYELKAPIDYALTLPILVIINSLGLDTDYDGIDYLDLEKMFNE